MSSKFFKKIESVFNIHKTVLFVFESSPFVSAGTFLFTVILGLLPLVNLYLIKLIVDSAASASRGENHDQERVLILVGIAGLFMVLIYLCQQISALLTRYQSILISDHVFKALHGKSISSDLQYYENPEYFDTLHRAQKEGPFRPSKIVNGLVSIFQNGVSSIGIAFLLFSFHWSMPFILLFSVIPNLFIKIRFAGVKHNWDMSKTNMERESLYLNFIITGYEFAKEIRLFGIGNFFKTRFQDIRVKLRMEEMKIAKRFAIYEFFSQFFSVVFVFIALGFIMVKTVEGAISVGAMVMYYQGLQRGLTFFKGFLSSLAELYEDNLFISNFYGFMELENKVRSIDNPLPFPYLDTLFIEFKDVSFSYPLSKKKVLENISFKISPGEIVSIVGENGAGKSTIVKLLCRLYDPDSGEILINGMDIKKYDISELRKNISVLFQDFIKYHFSVKENIGLGNIDLEFDHSKIEMAAKKSGVFEVIQNLPLKYETILGKMFKNGEELSIGQWQKIALARAFLKDTRILALDEPTSAMDADTEYEIFSNIRKLLSGKSAILISHRFSTIKMADRILVMNKGRLIEEGTHEELLHKKGVYSNWYAKQQDITSLQVV